MSITLVPLFVVALLMASTDPGVETVELVLTGEHRVDTHRGALVVGDAIVTVPAGAEIDGPVYVIGGELIVRGAIAGDVRQLAGTVRVRPEASIGGELQHIGGTQTVSEASRIGRRSSLAVVPAEGDPLAGALVLGVTGLLLAAIGAWRTRRRSRALDNVAQALGQHPVIVVTVGALVALTLLAVFVFMAFTLVLIPVAVLGLLAGLVTVAYGVIACGHLAGSQLPIRRRGPATALGVLLVIGLLRLANAIPIIGGTIVLAVLTAGLGAVLVTYFGVTRFRPEELPD